jgi:hypothetical protein
LGVVRRRGKGKNIEDEEDGIPSFASVFEHFRLLKRLTKYISGFL